MTIIQPSKINTKINLWIGGLIAALVFLAVSSVFIYNQLVNVRHEINNFKISLRETEIDNVELKNKFISLSGIAKAGEFAQDKNLILEKNPEYVKQQQLVANN